MYTLTDYEMSDGDLCEYIRAQENLAAMRTIARRMPWKAKLLKCQARACVAAMKQIEYRYSHA